MRKGNQGQGRPIALLRMILLGSLAVMLVTSLPAQDAGTATTRAAFGPVTPEHTLWRIASDHLPDQTVTIYQYMLALVETNPHAFIAGNASLMRSGVMLELPSAEAALAIPADEARQNLQQQNEWLASLSPAEVRAIRLGEMPVDTAAASSPASSPASPPAAAPAPEPEPEPLPEPAAVSEPESTVDLAAMVEAEFEWARPQTETADPLEEAGMDAPGQTEAESETPVGTERDTGAQPAPEAPADAEATAAPMTMRPGEPQPASQAATDGRDGLPLGWLALIGLVVLGALVMLLWRRRSVAAQGATETKLSSSQEAPAVAGTAAADSEARAMAAGEARARTDGTPRAKETEKAVETEATEETTEASQPAKKQTEPPVAPATNEKPPEPPAFVQSTETEPEEDDPWAGLEASILDQSRPTKSSEDADDIRAEDLESDPDPDTTSTPAETMEKPSWPGTMETTDVDFGRPDPEPLDDLVLSSELSPDAEAEIDETTDSLDLEQEMKPEAASEPASEPASGDRMSDSEAEISLDLAGILATTDDSDYARELLDEVIAKGSERMATRAREIRDSLSR